jgi:3-oxoacyl-[acyl-carrier protein] reductase
VHYLKEKEKAATVARQITESGGTAELFSAGVADHAAVKEMVRQVAERFGAIDVLVNNAGITRDRTIFKMTDEEWNSVIAANLSGAFFVLKECASAMARRKSGSIISIASLAAFKGPLGAANYASAKAGLVALTKSAAREFGRYAVRVNAVLPGFHMTDMGSSVQGGYADKARQESVLGISTDIQELAEFVIFLSTMKTVSGQVFNIDSRIF